MILHFGARMCFFKCFRSRSNIDEFKFSDAGRPSYAGETNKIRRSLILNPKIPRIRIAVNRLSGCTSRHHFLIIKSNNWRGVYLYSKSAIFSRRPAGMESVKAITTKVDAPCWSRMFFIVCRKRKPLICLYSVFVFRLRIGK